MAFFRRLLLAFQFMTRLPLPFDTKADARDFAAAAMFYPVTSLAVGAFMLGVYALCQWAGVGLLAAFAAVAGGYLITGALHLDGFADCCDAFFTGKPREELLRILKDSRMGTYGVLGIVCDAAVKTLLVYQISLLPHANMAAVLLMTPVAGKLALIMLPALAKYARPEGTGQSMVENMKPAYIIVCAVLAVAMIAVIFKLYAAVLVPLMLLAGVVIALRAKKRLGGITGDVMGAANEAGEMLFLLAIAVLYSHLG